MIQSGKVVASPGDISYAVVATYMHSIGWPDAEESKERIKENLKRWDPDQFEVEFLPKVAENEKDDVKEGVERMAKYLSTLLRHENAQGSDFQIFSECIALFKRQL
jgi:hypothetical protein